MTRKLRRLSSRYDIRAAMRRGCRIESPFFSVISRKNGLAYLRFASVASRAVDKRATARNRLRRRAREWVRVQGNILDRPLDIVLIFKKDAAAMRRKNFYEELDRIFKRIREGSN